MAEPEPKFEVHNAGWRPSERQVSALAEMLLRQARRKLASVQGQRATSDDRVLGGRRRVKTAECGE
jgi:hypothetical protein